MFEAYRIRPVVESMDEKGDASCEAFATLADAERDRAQFEARRSVSGREGKTIIWTLYGVNPEVSSVRTEDAIADCDTEESARELLTSIIGPFTTDEAGYSTSATLPANAATLLTSALGHIEKYKDTEEVDSLALAEDSIAAALNTLMQSRPAQADSAVVGTPGVEAAPADTKLHKVRLVWGSGASCDEKITADYEFASLNELNAFLKGCTEGQLGDFEQINPNPDGSFAWSCATRVAPSSCAHTRMTLHSITGCWSCLPGRRLLLSPCGATPSRRMTFFFTFGCIFCARRLAFHISSRQPVTRDDFFDAEGRGKSTFLFRGLLR